MNWCFETFVDSEMKSKVSLMSFINTAKKEMRFFSFTPWFINTHVKNYIDIIESDYQLACFRGNPKFCFPHSAFKMRKNSFVLKYSAFSKLLKEVILSVTVYHINELFEKQNYANLF